MASTALLFPCIQVASSDTEAKMFELERNSYFCPSADDYNRTGQDYVNDVTTILFNSQEVATQLLFHLEGKTSSAVCYSIYSAPSLSRCFLCFHTVDSVCSLLLCLVLDPWHCHIQWPLHSLHRHRSPVRSLGNNLLRVSGGPRVCTNLCAPIALGYYGHTCTCVSCSHIDILVIATVKL